MTDLWNFPKGMDSGSLHRSKGRLSRYSKSLTENMSESGKDQRKYLVTFVFS